MNKNNEVILDIYDKCLLETFKLMNKGKKKEYIFSFIYGLVDEELEKNLLFGNDLNQMETFCCQISSRCLKFYGLEETNAEI